MRFFDFLFGFIVGSSSHEPARETEYVPRTHYYKCPACGKTRLWSWCDFCGDQTALIDQLDLKRDPGLPNRYDRAGIPYRIVDRYEDFKK